MAQLLADDYEFGPNGGDHTVYLAASQPATVAYETAAGKFKDGLRGLNIATNDGFVKYVIAASAEIFFSVFLVPNATSNPGKQIIWSKSGVELGSLRWTGNMYQVHVGTDGTPEASGATTVPALGSGGALKNYQLRIKIGNTTTGSIQFKLDDVMEINYDAQDTQPGADTTIDEVSFGNQVIVDNLFVNDTTGPENNSWPGITRMYSDRPITASSEPGHDQWTGTAPGNKADLINGAVDPASFIYSTTVGNVQGFNYPTPCVPPGSTIKSITIVDLPIKISAGELKQGVTIAGVDYVSGSKALATVISAGAARLHHMPLNPATGNPWTVTENPQTYLEHA